MTKKSLLYRPNRFVAKMRDDINNPRAALNAMAYFVTRGSRGKALFYAGLLGAAGYLSSGGNARLFTEYHPNPSQSYMQKDNLIDINTQARPSRENRELARSNLESLSGTTAYSVPASFFSELK